MTDRETRYEHQSEAPLVPAIPRTDEPTELRPESTRTLRSRVGSLVGPLQTLTHRGGR